MYNYWLGGKDNFAVDRAAGDAILRSVPRQRRHVRANRAFLVRVVRYLVAEAGIRQIIDIGSGLPATPNVHEIAHEIAPDTRVVYVDNDQIVLAHARVLMPMAHPVNPAAVDVVEGDLRRPDTITSLLRSSPLIDPDTPTAVLLLAMLMSLTDDDRPHDVVAELLDPLPAGSYLAATHTTADLDPMSMDGYVKAARNAGLMFTPRSRPDFERFFDGLDLVAPGVVSVQAWRPELHTGRGAPDVYIYAGLGRVP